MTDCGCDKARAELEEYLHRELNAEDVQMVEEHLSGCEDCTGEHLVGLILTQKVRQACQEKAPVELRDAIISELTLTDV
jgi:anti-sigma factor (TIGR02949 family)